MVSHIKAQWEIFQRYIEGYPFDLTYAHTADSNGQHTYSYCLCFKGNRIGQGGGRTAEFPLWLLVNLVDTHLGNETNPYE